MSSWNDLRRPLTKPDIEPDPFDAACAQALSSPAGRQLMQLLHRKYIDAVLVGTPDDRALANNHAKRQLVRELEEHTARGLAALKKEKTA